jgi:MFS family permease
LSILQSGKSAGEIRKAGRSTLWWSAAVPFLLNGAGIGLWAAFIPVLAERHDLDPFTLGLILFAFAGAGIASMPLAARAISRLGSGLMDAVLTAGFCIGLAGPLLSPSLSALVAAVILFGVMNGAMDVAMNSHGGTIEHLRGRPTMSSFHGCWSIGGLMGAVAGGTLIGQELTGATSTSVVVVIGLSMALAAAPGLLAAFLPVASVNGTTAPGGSTSPAARREAWVLGLIALLCMAGEGVAADWSALFLRIEAGSSPAFASAGYSGFALTMAVCRFLGDRTILRFGALRVARTGGLLVALGIGMAVAVPTPALSALGFALMGLGAANIMPLVFSSAGRISGLAQGAGVATVAAIGYTGYLAVPPLFGFVAELMGLRAALALIAISGLAIALSAGILHRQPQSAVAA